LLLLYMLLQRSTPTLGATGVPVTYSRVRYRSHVRKSIGRGTGDSCGGGSGYVREVQGSPCVCFLSIITYVYINKHMNIFIHMYVYVCRRIGQIGTAHSSTQYSTLQYGEAIYIIVIVWDPLLALLAWPSRRLVRYCGIIVGLVGIGGPVYIAVVIIW